MKKFIFCFILFFMVMIGVNAETFNADTKLPDHTIRVSDGVHTYDDYLSLLKRSDGEPVYCINPYEVLDTNKDYSTYEYNADIFNISQDKLNKINLIAYYGYGYPGHYEDKWYGVTQFLIWKELGFGDIYYTNRIGGVESSKFQNEINELEVLVGRYTLRPSFFNKYLEYDLNKQYTINDSSGFVNNYELESSMDAYIKDSKLYINTSIEEGIFELKFKKKSPTNRNYLLYKLDGAQSLIYPGKFDMEYTMYVEVANRTIEVHKQDSEGINRTDVKLEGAVYELYNTAGKIGTLVTDSNGIAKRENLPKGDYYVKEITPSVGYKLDNNKYHVYLDRYNHNAIINSYEKVIKGSLNIKKYYGENNIYSYEDGAIFEIYDSNNNIIDRITTIDGLTSVLLPYGEYTIKQINSKEGYKKVEDFKVNIEKEKSYYFDLYNEKEEKIIEPDPIKPEIVKQEIQKVNVPNTGKYNSHHKIIYGISFLFIITGIVLIILGKKKLLF